jgi:hypothetical protein
VDLRPGVAVVPATQATRLSSSSKVTLKVTSISVSTSSNTRGSFLSSSSIVRTTRKEEISTSARTTRHLAFLPQQPTRTTSSSSARRRPHMFPLWGTRPLGGSLPKEGHSVVASFQHLSKTRSTTTSTRRPWSGLQLWKGEPFKGRSNLGCSGRGSRYVSSRILSSKSII